MTASPWPQPTDRYPRPVPDSARSADSAATSPSAWEAPTPLGTAGQPPTFPVEALPDWLADFVRSEATATQTPADLAGMLVLAALATVAGGLAEIQVRPGWREPLNLFTAVAMPPGSRKSAVVADVTRPLVRFDKDEAQRMQAIIVQETTAKKIAERAAEQAQAAAGKATEGQRDDLVAEAVAAAERAAAIHVPPTPRMLADDATPEALASLLAEHGRIALLSPEGGPLDMMAGRYQSNGPNLDVYLKGHAGDAIRVDRKGRPPEFVDRPALTIGLAVQPEVLRTLKDQPGFRAAVSWPDSCTPSLPTPLAAGGSAPPRSPRRSPTATVSNFRPWPAASWTRPRPPAWPSLTSCLSSPSTRPPRCCC